MLPKDGRDSVTWTEVLATRLFPYIVTGKTLDFEAAPIIKKNSPKLRTTWEKFLQANQVDGVVELKFENVLRDYRASL